jgi:PhnB protein
MKLVTALSFSGQCREALEFYRSVLGGEVRAFPYRDAPPGMPVDGKYDNWLMHGWLQIGEEAIMGADMPPEFAPNIGKPKNGFDVSFHSDDPAESRRVYDALSDGGTPGMAFGETFWSPGFGTFTDRFGIPWMINTNPAEGWQPGEAAQ